MRLLSLALIFLLFNSLYCNKWTILGYFADDNLNGTTGSMMIMERIANLESFENIEIAIQADTGTSSYHFPWSDTRRFKMEPLEEINNYWDFDQLCVDSTLSEQNMGDGETLTQFINWGVETYPSDRYILIIKNHGGGWRKGVCFDYTDNDVLEIKEIKDALSSSFETTGKRIDIAVFDACVMGMIEVAYELKDNISHSIISSQNYGLVPQIFNYQAFIDKLNSQPNAELDSVATFFFETPNNFLTTLSAVRTETLHHLTDEIKSFTNQFISNPSWTLFEESCNNSTKHYDSFFDIKLLLNQLEEGGYQSDLSNLYELYDNTIIMNDYNSNQSITTGLNIYINHFFNSDYIDYNETFSSFAEDSNWKNFIKEYKAGRYNHLSTFDHNFIEAWGDSLKGYWSIIDNNDDYDSKWRCKLRDTPTINSYGYQCDDYLITPRLKFSENSKFSVELKSLLTTNLDKFSIKLSTSGYEDAEDFDITLLEETIVPSTYTSYEVDLSSYKNQKIYLALHCTSDNGSALEVSKLALLPTSNTEEEIFLDTPMLYSNYPNPFNPTTTIDFSIPNRGDVELVIYNIEGKQVGSLVCGVVDRGLHSVKFDGSQFSSGTYFYQLKTESYSDIKKMILIK